MTTNETTTLYNLHASRISTECSVAFESISQNLKDVVSEVLSKEDNASEIIQNIMRIFWNIQNSSKKFHEDYSTDALFFMAFRISYFLYLCENGRRNYPLSYETFKTPKLSELCDEQDKDVYDWMILYNYCRMHNLNDNLGLLFDCITRNIKVYSNCKLTAENVF